MSTLTATIEELRSEKLFVPPKPLAACTTFVQPPGVVQVTETSLP